VHDSQQCPSCASESFAFITRWVPVPERTQKRPPPPEIQSPETLSTYRELLHPETKSAGGWRAVRRGAMGLAVFGLAGWIWRSSRAPAEGGQPDGGTDKPQG
jgi:hypothetical protein